MKAPQTRVLEGRNIIVTASYSRPVDERPIHDTIDAAAEWLATWARAEPSLTKILDELAWRLIAAGIPLARVTFHGGTLHPQFLGTTYIWRAATSATQKVMITHDVTDLVPYDENPVRRVREGGEILRRRLDGPEAEFDFAVLFDIAAAGGTEYFALPVESPFGFGAYMMSFASRRPGGFEDGEIADLTRISGSLSIIADMSSQKQIAENVLSAYLGAQTGPLVLAGKIQRGSGEEISAVIWSSDLRGFTFLSDHTPAAEVIATLNALFDIQARAIAAHGGEILKFIGDGVLAIFPVSSAEVAGRATENALAAAREALGALGTIESISPLRLVVALHIGTVIYGNIGSADRLDFTVIGPAVNLVSRIEAIAKAQDLPLIVSDDFAALRGNEGLRSLGRHQLRGLDRAHELFALA